jgi:hypothetical protein
MAKYGRVEVLLEDLRTGKQYHTSYLRDFSLQREPAPVDVFESMDNVEWGRVGVALNAPGKSDWVKYIRIVEWSVSSVDVI